MSHCKSIKNQTEKAKQKKKVIEKLQVFMYDSDERQGLGKECKWVLLRRVKGKNSRKKNTQKEIEKDNNNSLVDEKRNNNIVFFLFKKQ